ncbi:MAG TPA: LPS-assembly protein LptD [Flavobacteriales bacterium]|nr:LPS-assembly protein LptD [Flavobacteriales bacterium]
MYITEIKENIRGIKVLLTFLFLMLLLKNEAIQAQDEALSYTASDSIVLVPDSSLVFLYGNVKVLSGEIELTAHRVVYNTDLKEACAYGTQDSLGNWVGRPVFKQGASIFTQDQLCYNFNTQKGFSHHAVTSEGELVFHAATSKRLPGDQIHVLNGKFTTCDADNPHFHFHLTKAILYPDDKVVAGPLYMKFRKIPTPLALPFAWFPLNQEKRSHGILLPSYGDGGSLGFFLKDLGYYLPIGENLDTRLLFDIYSGGSWALKNISQYNYRYRSNGNFTLSYNRRVNGFPGMPGFGAENNFFVRWAHTQDVRYRPNRRFSASLNFGSTDIFQENLNSSMEDYLSNTFQSSVQWSYTSPRSPFSLTTSARHSQNSLTGNVSLTLPSATLTMGRRTVSDLFGLEKGRSNVLDGISVSYVSRFENVAEISDSALAALDFAELDIKNGLKHTVSASSSGSLGFITFAPSFQYDEFMAFSSLEKSLGYDLDGNIVELTDTVGGFVSDRNLRASVSANSRFYGLYSFKNSNRIKAIRHVLSPSVSLSYTPERTRNQTHILDEESITWNPWELGRFKPVDLRESGALNFSLGQNLEAKILDPTTGNLRKIKIIDSFSSSASYNFLADSLQLSDINSRGFTNLFNRVNLNVTATHSAYARDTSGYSISSFLVSQGSGQVIRLKRATASVGTTFKGGAEGGYPWNARFDYTMNLSRVFDTELQSDTSALRHGIAMKGGVKLFSKWDIDIQTGYDIILREFTPTAVNIHWDLHCWELTFNWIPFGTRQSFALRLNIKSSLLKDIKIEARGANGNFLF